MTRKPFEQLTFADDFMFCKVMEHESLCRPFLEMLFTAQIGKITYLSTQDNVTAHSDAKTVRLDVLVKDENGTSYDIEMFFPIDIRAYRKNEFCLVSKHRCCMKPAASVPLLKQTCLKKPSVGLL